MTTDDVVEITNLIYRVAELRDLGDFEGVGDIFAHSTFRTVYAGTTDSHGVQYGRDQLIEGFRAMIKMHKGSPRTKYLTTNLRVDIDDDAGFATAHSYYVVLQATEALPLQIISAGRYVDRFAHINSRWHFTDRLILADFSGKLSEHLAVAPATYGEQFTAQLAGTGGEVSV